MMRIFIPYSMELLSLIKLIRGCPFPELLRARLKVKVTSQAPQADAVSIKTLQICSVPSVSYYFTSHPSVVAPFPSRSSFSKVNYEEIPWNATDGSMDIVAYVPVNLRGENTSVTNPSEKNKYAPDGSTDLLVTATCTDDGRE